MIQLIESRHSVRLDANWTMTLLEAAQRPGVLGLAGEAVEKQCARELRMYFAKLGSAIINLELENIAARDTTEDLGVAKNAVEMRIENVLRKHRPLLLDILVQNIYRAMLVSWKVDAFAEADDDSKKDFRRTLEVIGQDLDRLGLTGQRAADYAAKQAAKLVTGIDRTTRKQIADLVAKGISERMGVPKLGRLIREEITKATRYRAELIASTEMNDAMSQAALEKMKAIGVEYKQLIISPGACERCESIRNNGPIPVGDPFVDLNGDTYDRTPIHPGCRCATTGARPPKENE